MLFPPTIRRNVCDLSGGRAAILMTVILAMSSAGLIAIVYILATSGSGDLLDNIRGLNVGGAAAISGSIHRGRSHSGLQEANAGGPMNGENNDGISPMHSNNYHQNAIDADRHLMRQRIVHHLLPTVSPSSSTTVFSTHIDEENDNDSVPTTLLSSSSSKEDGHIYIDGEDDKSMHVTEASALAKLVIDTTEDITSIEYFDQIIADHKERSRHRASHPKFGDWPSTEDKNNNNNNSDDDDDTIRTTKLATIATTTTLRPGRSINSRIDSKTEPELVAPPRQLLKQHLHQKKRPLVGQQSPQIVQTQAEILPASSNAAFTRDAFDANSDDEDYDNGDDMEGSGSGDFQLQSTERSSFTTHRPIFDTRWWRQQRKRQRAHNRGDRIANIYTVPPLNSATNMDIKKNGGHFQRLGSNGAPVNVAWQADTRAMRIMGNVRISEERSRQLLLCEEAGGGELCRMLFKGHLAASEPSTSSSSSSSTKSSD